jgi:GntR family transcriptional regulator/MocR family aminotransferase
VLFPSLRIGYLVVPSSLMKEFTEKRESLDLFQSTLYQVALTDFLTEGHFARHIRRMRGVYLKRRNKLDEGIGRRLRQTLTIVSADAGMHLTAWLPSRVNDRSVVRRAASRGITTALSTHYMGRTPRVGLVLGFGGADEAQIDHALDVRPPAAQARSARFGRCNRSAFSVPVNDREPV